MLEFVKYYLMYEFMQIILAFIFIALAIGGIFLWGWVADKREDRKK